jgi:hypothetical protein
VSAFVTGCAGSAEELSRFTAAWQRVRLSDSPGIPGSGSLGDGTCSSASLPVIDAGQRLCWSGGRGHDPVEEVLQGCLVDEAAV